jgi:PAS domain S-box-containing protein
VTDRPQWGPTPPATIRVLHVDDDPGIVDVVGKLLAAENERIDTTAVQSPVEGLDLLQSSTFDCVVSDYSMPKMDGIEFLQSIRETRPDLPFILFTSEGSESVAGEAIAAGATGYLQKAAGREQYAVLANRIENAAKQYRAEQFAEETGRRLRELMENTPDVRWMFNADWSELLYVNDAYEGVFGGSVTKLRERPRSFLATIHPDDRDPVREAMERVSRGETVDMDFRVDPRCDYERWVHSSGRPVLEDGEVVRIVGYSREVTERREREGELRKTRQLLTRSLDALDDIYYMLDPDGRIRRWNDTVESVTGHDGDSIEGTVALEYIAEQDHGNIEAAIDEAIETGSARVDARVLAADGDSVPYEFTGARIEDESGDLRGIIGIGRDISEHRKHEKTLETQNERLEAFTAIVSHDLRNPLTAIDSHLELYRATGDEEHLEALSETVDRMERLLEDLLHIARYGEGVEDPSPVAPERVVRTAQTGTLTAADALTYEPMPELYAEADRLHRLFENLFRNAVEHAASDGHGSGDDTTGATADGGSAGPGDETDDGDGDGNSDSDGDGGVDIRVGPLTDEAGGHVGFYVADDGPGIPQTDRERVFESGYSTSDSGTGYGLTVVESVAQAHGWEITVTDSETGGACFEVRGVTFVDDTTTRDRRIDADVD